MEFNFDPLEWHFAEALSLIVLACIWVPLVKKLGFGRIIGYLAAGICAGALLTLSYSKHPEELLHFAEFGVVLFLFVIGLELRPDHLWGMRKEIFGRGFMQVMICGALLFVPATLYGLEPKVAITVALGLALSSTALVMQGLDEKGQRGTPTGRSALSILLFEDMAIVPLLLMVQLLSAGGSTGDPVEATTSVILGVLAIVLLVLIGRYGLDPMFRRLAQARTPEIMTASALGVVIGAALLMDMVGLSYAMGAFIAGVMLAESSYRHELEADIEPFRGLFLGLFFMAIGLSLNLDAVIANILTIAIALPITVGLKITGVYIAGRLFGSDHKAALKVAATLSQHGEFGFVLFSAATLSGLLSSQLGSLVVVIITLSMMVSPLIERFLMKLANRSLTAEDDAPENGEPGHARGLIIGFGRVGQVAAEALMAQDIPVTMIDNDPRRVVRARGSGAIVYFGEGGRREVLQAAGAAHASIIVICSNNMAAVDHQLEIVQRHFPQAKTLVRAYNRTHEVRLRRRHADFVVLETQEAGFALGHAALRGLGSSELEADEIIEQLRRNDAEDLRNRLNQEGPDVSDPKEA
ncbi:MAG: monovalent cation:proton antiporter-2 (CPA2) family protein [Alphaproteobacteria bacterium]|nr:monovalent cation:proton antiporter-2 (CPA2) family protein [Alphaproteobacteria bacterium SS10]